MTNDEKDGRRPDRRAAGAMAAARAEFPAWRSTPPEDRAARLGGLRRRLVGIRDEVVGRISADTGKTRAEALTSDLLPTLELLRYLEKNAARILRPRRAHTPFIFRASTSRIEYRPRGVVLVIAPWNNPLQLSLVPAASALAAGNAVILKPSERAPATGEVMGRLFEHAGWEEGAFQVVDGGPEVARALVAAGPDLIFFTGGTENGRAVYEAAAARLIPVILELGGKDPMILFADADLDRAARGAVYGAFAHAGQHCVSVKRLYVEASVYEQFLQQVADETRSLAATSDWGRVIDDQVRAKAREQVREAVAAGARLLTPGDENQAGATPTLVADVEQSMPIVQDETFAPVLAARAFETEAEAADLANDSRFGLNASVWTQDEARADRVVRRLQTGNVYVNNVLVNVGNPWLPFGGTKASGIGRYHGADGLRAFCLEASVMVSRNRAGTEPNWFPRGEQAGAIAELIELRYGDSGSWWGRLGRWLSLLRRM